MKIFGQLGPMSHEVASRISYIQHMKSSKYCICPRLMPATFSSRKEIVKLFEFLHHSLSSSL